MPHQNGYTVRSRYIVETVHRAGWADLRVVTSPFYPGQPASIEEAEIAGVPHHRVPHPADDRNRLDLGAYFVRILYRVRKNRMVVALHKRLVRMRKLGGPCGPEALAAPQTSDWRSRTKDVFRRLLLPAPVKTLIRSAARWVLSLAPARWAVDDLERRLELLEERMLLSRFARQIARTARAKRVELIHAHSPFRTALPAIRAARAVGIPVVYEVRGLWEESAVASGRWQPGDARHTHWKSRETEAMLGADAVIAIGKALAAEVVSRGVSPERVFVVPNAVDAERFEPVRPEDLASAPPEVVAALTDLEQRLSGTVLGYVGSVRAMEGVAELVRGAAEILRTGRDVSVLVVGDGPDRKVLARLAEELGIADRVVLPGRVPHEHVAHYYRLIDVFVVSRPDFPVTRTVTPLKPLEAMAMGKALVVSDLPALREMVEDGQTGLIYRPGDPADLAAQAIRLIDHPRDLAAMGERARRWVAENRSWNHSLAVLPEVYRAATEHHRGRDGAR
jgi:glycosyltransferase involved in cell wall biosynthesis